MQGCQLSPIERESHAWTLFLTLSRQACKISRMTAKHPAKHVKPHFLLKLKPHTQFDAKDLENVLFSFHVLVSHAKQFSKVDSAAKCHEKLRAGRPCLYFKKAKMYLWYQSSGSKPTTHVA